MWINKLLQYQLEIDRENRQKAQAKQKVCTKRKTMTEEEKRAKIARLKQRLAKEDEARLKRMQRAGGQLSKSVEVRYQPI